jgi:hypothetical protein
MGTYRDAYGNTINLDDALVNYTGGYNPLLGSPEDVKRQTGKAVGTLGTQLAIGAVPTAIQLGGVLSETAQDTFNAKELAKLEGLAERGRLGLSGGERQHAEATIMNPVRELAQETRQRSEGRLASLGDTGNVAGMQRVARAEQEGVSKAAATAGIEIERAHLQKAAEQRKEMEERIAYKSARQKQPWELLGKALTDLAPALGVTAAGFAEKRKPYDAELLAYARAKGKDGKPLHPGIFDADAKSLMTMWQQGTLLEAGNINASTLASGDVLATAPM